MIKDLAKQIQELEAEIRRLRKALQFYAYKRTWENHHFDLGEIAREALEGEKEE